MRKLMALAAGALCLAWLLPGVCLAEVYTLNGQVVDIITPAYPEETHMTIMLWVNNPPASLLRETNIPQPTNVLGISEVPREPWLGLNTIVKIKVEPGEPFSGNQRSIRFISWSGTSSQAPSPQASGGASFQAVISEGGAPLTEAPMPSNGFCNRYTPHEGLAPLRISTPPGQHYLVKLVDMTTGLTVMDTFIYGGSSVLVRVPLGKFELRYASGQTWHGYHRLFGSETLYGKANYVFDFRMEANRLTGFSVALYPVAYTATWPPPRSGTASSSRALFRARPAGTERSGGVDSTTDVKKSQSIFTLDGWGNSRRFMQLQKFVEVLADL